MCKQSQTVPVWEGVSSSLLESCSGTNTGVRPESLHYSRLLVMQFFMARSLELHLTTSVTRLV